MQQHKIISILLGILAVAGVIYLGVLSRNAMKTYDYIGISAEQRHSITITGEGKVVGVPDIAKIQLGYNIEKKTVAEAQKDNTDKMNALIDKLKKDFKIDAKDIQTTNYNIYPQYDWSNNRQTLRGYQVSQNVSIKVREIDKVSSILDSAGQLDLNQVGSLAFEIDNPENLKQQARELAIKAAKEKAEALAKIAGVKLGKIISFSESINEPSSIYRDYGMGAEKAMSSVAVPAPQVEAGSTEIIINAIVEYEIL
ncbi:MAG: SIMPL domain-containing protein [Patescibacteria group bacterium]|nr:SIMPL domain-containing protein [Patescibacteria group bacterium]MDD4611022.1 SIMPL domain-containing protein [Patescibacteria group bacterium]